MAQKKKFEPTPENAHKYERVYYPLAKQWIWIRKDRAKIAKQLTKTNINRRFYDPSITKTTRINA
jgi:hypothetical protein